MDAGSDLREINLSALEQRTEHVENVREEVDVDEVREPTATFRV